MSRIGRKIYYNMLSGIVLWDKGEMQGDVRETTLEEDIQAMPMLAKNPIAFIQLAFGERSDEFLNMGSMRVENRQLIIYPRLTISTNKTHITSDGIDTATISSDYAESFSIDGEEYAVNPLLFSSIAPGSYIITAKSTLHGQNSIIVEVV